MITDKEKYIERVKHAISDSNKIVQLCISPEKYLSYITSVKKKIKQLLQLVSAICKGQMYFFVISNEVH